MRALVDLTSTQLLELEARWGAHNYAPLPVVVARAEGVWVYDTEGRRYLDCLSAYSAVNQGHAHPAILAALQAQASRVTLTSRAFHNDQLPLFCYELAELARRDVVLPMNTGAEAVETAIKAARRWAYERKGVPRDRAEVIVCSGNFHGRTTTLVSASSDPEYREGFGPFTPGFVTVPFGDADALSSAINPRTAAFLVEPIQCEAGIILPPPGYLARASQLCQQHQVLFIADEIQTGLGRTGAWFACQHDRVEPDLYVLGKALSGGFYPISAVVGRRDVLDVFTPGSHGSTYGGNPLGVCRCARRPAGDCGRRPGRAVCSPWRRVARRPQRTRRRGPVGAWTRAPCRYRARSTGAAVLRTVDDAWRALQGHTRHRDSSGATARDRRSRPAVDGP